MMGTPPVSSNSSQTLVHDASLLDAEPEPSVGYRPSPYEAALWGDKPIPPLQIMMPESEDSDSDSDDEHEYYQEEHGDHQDWVVYWSPWKNWPTVGRGWPHDFMRRLDMSKPNDELLGDPDSRRWLRKLSHLEHKDLPSLKVWTKGKPKIPLFKDELTGDEYQIHLRLGLRSGVASIKCPVNLVPSPESPDRWIPRADPLHQIRYRLPQADDPSSRTISPPEFVIPLGKLAVRTHVREQWQTGCTKDDPPPTEFTDYLVVVDAGHKDLPVWILVSQDVLRDRRDFKGKDYPQLPVFRGAMGNDEYGFDTACIFRSIHDLARHDFDQAYELVRSTRSVRDPRMMRIAAEKMAELSGTELRDDWDGLTPNEVVTAEDAEEEANH